MNLTARITAIFEAVPGWVIEHPAAVITAVVITAGFVIVALLKTK